MHRHLSYDNRRASPDRLERRGRGNCCESGLLDLRPLGRGMKVEKVNESRGVTGYYYFYVIEPIRDGTLVPRRSVGISDDMMTKVRPKFEMNEWCTFKS